MKSLSLALLLSGVGFLNGTVHAQVAPQTPISEDLTLGGDAKATDGATSEMISPDTIQFPNNPVSDFLMVYEKLKGITLIKDASLLAGGANLSLTLNQPVSKAEAIRLLESTLLLNGYAFIAVDKNSVKVINTAGGKIPEVRGSFCLPTRVNCLKVRLLRLTSCRSLIWRRVMRWRFLISLLCFTRTEAWLQYLWQTKL